MKALFFQLLVSTVGADDRPQSKVAAKAAETGPADAGSKASWSSLGKEKGPEAEVSAVRDQKVSPSTEKAAKESPRLPTDEQSKQSAVKASRPSSAKARSAKRHADGQLQRNSATFNPLL